MTDLIIKIITGKELLEKEMLEIENLVDPIFPKVGIVSITGSSDIGKSSFLRQLAISVVLKQDDFLGFKINATHNSVIYVATEDDEDSTAVLMRKVYNGDFEYQNYEGLRFIFETDNLIVNLESELNRAPADCIIVDTYSDIFRGNINQANEVRTFLNEYKELAQRHRCLIIFLHHTRKKTDGSAPSKENTLGSQGFEAKMRCN